MEDLIKYIIEGKNITFAFQESFLFWNEFYNTYNNFSYEALKDIVNYKLLEKFKLNLSLENQYLYKSIFILSAMASISYIYNKEGKNMDNENFPKLLLKVFKNSVGYPGSLSFEILSEIDIISKIYNINIADGQ